MFEDAEEDAVAVDDLDLSDDDDYEDDDYDDWIEDESGRIRPANFKSKNSQQQQQQQQQQRSSHNEAKRFQPSDKVDLGKFADRINLDKYCNKKSLNPVLEQQKRAEKDRYRVKDKADRATMEQVMDPRTRMILFKLLNRGFVSSVDGCISTGKEANVYHCTNREGASLAVKIYKTSILVFKDRDKYVSGEFRFRQGYGRKNPRKMVKTWAEKEMRNLTRLHNAGIACPRPILLR